MKIDPGTTYSDLVETYWGNQWGDQGASADTTGPIAGGGNAKSAKPGTPEWKSPFVDSIGSAVLPHQLMERITMHRAIPTTKQARPADQQLVTKECGANRHLDPSMKGLISNK